MTARQSVALVAVAALLAGASPSFAAVKKAAARPVSGCVDRLAAPQRPVNVAFPEEAPRVNAQVSVIARVHADGSQDTSSLYRSSGYTLLDDNAQTAVENTPFRSASKNCVAYSSTPVVQVGYNAGDRADTIEPSKICSQGDAVLRDLARPAPPGSPARRHDRGTVQVLVTVEADGRVSAAVLYHGAGSRRIEREALRVARASSYSAGADADCVTVQSTYILELRFT